MFLTSLRYHLSLDQIARQLADTLRLPPELKVGNIGRDQIFNHDCDVAFTFEKKIHPPNLTDLAASSIPQSGHHFHAPAHNN